MSPTNKRFQISIEKRIYAHNKTRLGMENKPLDGLVTNIEHYSKPKESGNHGQSTWKGHPDITTH